MQYLFLFIIINISTAKKDKMIIIQTCFVLHYIHNESSLISLPVLFCRYPLPYKNHPDSDKNPAGWYSQRLVIVPDLLVNHSSLHPPNQISDNNTTDNSNQHMHDTHNINFFRFIRFAPISLTLLSIKSNNINH